MQSVFLLTDGAGEGAQRIATDGSANRHAVMISDKDGTIEADDATDVDNRDDCRGRGTLF